MNAKTNTMLAIMASILILSVTANAMLIPLNEIAKENSQAPGNSNAIDEDWNIQRHDFIHYARPSGPGKNPKTACYVLIGAKWPTLSVNYVINPANPQSLSESFITSTLSSSAEKWDNATSKELFNNSYQVDYNTQPGVRDSKNTLGFGNYGDNNVIAVTSLWVSNTGAIVEADVLFNTLYTWGDASIDPSLMDLDNIGTHELGHTVGMGDVYNSACLSVTMFGYSGTGDIEKRTLESADITGLRKIYGN
ncbi:MAG: hypothetical protein Q7S27_05650 [Nanoarchaeota archaeon]|nr:hypothetical protein [Nanoarchaeota archaeon]